MNALVFLALSLVFTFFFHLAGFSPLAVPFVGLWYWALVCWGLWFWGWVMGVGVPGRWALWLFAPAAPLLLVPLLHPALVALPFALVAWFLAGVYVVWWVLKAAGHRRPLLATAVAVATFWLAGGWALLPVAHFAGVEVFGERWPNLYALTAALAPATAVGTLAAKYAVKLLDAALRKRQA